MKLDRTTVFALVAVFATGWFMGSREARPAPTDRPVVRWIAGAAKRLLWLAVLADPPPKEPASRLVQAPPIGEDGYPVLDNSRSF